MPNVTFIAHDGQRTTVQAERGSSLMLAAVDHGVRGIDGDCGGQCACATCHVFIEPPWDAVCGPRTATEQQMLAAASDLRESSRLACQITLGDAHEGLVVQLPDGQH